MQGINVVIMSGGMDLGNLKAVAMAGFLERKISHLDNDNQISIYQNWIKNLEEKEEE